VSGVWKRLLLLFAVAVAVFAAFSIYADVGELRGRLGALAPAAVVAALGLALANYAIRFVRWHLYLRRAGAQVPAGTSLHVFLAGFAMGITPGKVGELVKAALLRDATGTPVAQTAPVVVAERLTDLVALVILCLVGFAAYGVAGEMVAAAAVFVALGLLVIVYRPMARWVIDAIGKARVGEKLAPKLREAHDQLIGLVRPWPLGWGAAMGVAAWLAECIGFALVVRGFPGADVSLGLATLIYAATTIAGALSFLPGGLVVTEASMTLLLVSAASGLDQPTAVAATIVTRLCTLWFAVALGVIALAVPRKKVAA
jgi:uncharacterized protein (TIRG00374 family)